MKFIEILLAFLTSQGSSLVESGTSAVSRKVVENARKIVILLSLNAIAIALFCSGFMMAYANLMDSLDRPEIYLWSAHFIGGIVLVSLSIGLFIYSLGEKRWLNAVNAAPEAPVEAKKEPTLQSAAALLIVEIAYELKERRARAQESEEEEEQEEETSTEK